MPVEVEVAWHRSLRQCELYLHREYVDCQSIEEDRHYTCPCGRVFVHVPGVIVDGIVKRGSCYWRLVRPAPSSLWDAAECVAGPIEGSAYDDRHDG